MRTASPRLDFLNNSAHLYTSQANRSCLQNTHIAMTVSSGSTSAQVVLGSMERAEEYQQLLLSLQESAGAAGKVQGEMVDRILDNGKSFWLGHHDLQRNGTGNDTRRQPPLSPRHL